MNAEDDIEAHYSTAIVCRTVMLQTPVVAADALPMRYKCTPQQGAGSGSRPMVSLNMKAGKRSLIEVVYATSLHGVSPFYPKAHPSKSPRQYARPVRLCAHPMLVCAVRHDRHGPSWRPPSLD